MTITALPLVQHERRNQLASYSYIISYYCSTACVEGDLRLVGGIYYEGRLEICLNSEWGAVCGVEEYRSQIRNREVRDVACRQLGFPSSTRSSTYIITVLVLAIAIGKWF